MNRDDYVLMIAKDLCASYNKCKGCGSEGNCDVGISAQVIYDSGYRKLHDNIGDFSDGYHTFNELYHHRAVLFSVICNMFSEKAWKSKLHDTGDMFDGMFIVGIETEQGQATYHYDIDPYWDMFKVKELEKAPKWDGHSPTDAIQRIGNIKQSEDAIKMTLDNLLMLIGNYEQIIVIEGNLPFVDKHIYTGLNSDFFTFCRENKLHSLRQRSVRSIECGVNVIYIFIEKETNQ